MSAVTAFPGENTNQATNIKTEHHSSKLDEKRDPFETPFDEDEDEEEWWEDDEKHEDEENIEGEDRVAEDEEYPGNPENTPNIHPRTTLWPTSEHTVDYVEEFKTVQHTVTVKTVKRYSVQKPVREKSRGRQRKQNAKAGIKVITDFPKRAGPAQPAPQLAQAQPVVSEGPHGSQTGNFITLATLQALDKEVPVEPTGWNFWSKKTKDSKPEAAKPLDKAIEAPPTSTQGGMKSRRKSLIPAPLRLEDDLSPNDRPIVIGLTVSSARLAEHALSPESAVSDASRILTNDRGADSPKTQTPTIMITRASGDPTFSPVDENRNRRPTSSIYSQATNVSPNPNSSVPPVRAVPAYMMKAHTAQQGDDNRSLPLRESTNTVFEEDVAFPQRSPTRRTSTFTVFEEDETPTRAPAARFQPNGPPNGDLGRNDSISTPATNRRSKGWWNYVTTPFMTRSNTVAARQGTMKEGQPTTPNLEAAAIRARDSDRTEQVWEKEFTPTTATTISESWWDRNGNRDAEQRSPEATIERGAGPDRGGYVRTHRAQESTGTLPFVMSGAIERDDSGQPPLPSNNLFHNQESSNNPYHNSRESMSTFVSRRAERDLARQASAATAFSNNDREIPLVFDIDSPVQSRNNPFMPPRPSVTSSAPVSRQQADPYENYPPPPPPPVPAPANGRNITNTRPELEERVESQDRVANNFDSPRAPPPYSPPRTQYARFQPRDVAHTTAFDNSQRPPSPGPVSPGMQQVMTSAGGIPLHDVPLESPRRRPINLNSGYPGSLPPRSGGAFVTAADLVTPGELARKAEAKRKRHEKKEALAHKIGGLWRGRGCFPKKGCFGRKGNEGRKKKKRYICLIIAFLLVIATILSLSLTLTRKSHDDELTQWLNLTGFPPIFLGVSTIAVPVNTLTDTSCVTPATFWSCDLPKELQSTVAPNGANQPNFRLQIQWDNSSAANATFANVTGNKELPVKRSMSASQFFKRMLLGSRQAPSFTPVPTAPSFAEEFFLGNTTDGIVSAEKAGEPTPFFITFLSPTAVVGAAELNILRKRKATPTSTSASSSSTSDSNSSTESSFPDIISGIPPPSINTADGSPSPANLLPSPLPISQPVRLYDRGLPTEHYSFYSYFDRSIFLSSVNLTTDSNPPVITDENGGAEETEAKFRCTWAQTRFLVQIWTNMGTTASLNNITALEAGNDNTQISNKKQPSRNITANNFSQPGSFPYPVTVTLDRHGGDATKKEIYCYQVGAGGEEDGIGSGITYLDVHPTFQLEDRAAGGTLISPAPSVFDNSTVVDGGVDGGTGGCKCGWQNWVAVS